jgi:two-component system chemotaxis sensor kinase CheA
VARRRVQARSVDAAELLDFAQRWRAEWSALEKTLVRALAHSGPSRRLTQAVARNGDHLKHLDREFRRLASNIAEDHRLLEQAGMPLEVEVRRVRMLPFAEACEGLDRMSRDLARKSGKTVDLVVEGGGIEFDRSILEGVKDPLLHLLRNAVDHGIELPAVRRAVGKPAVGRITVAAALRGGVIEVTVADDGAGLDIEAIREQAHRRGLPPMPVRELIRSVFLPGFSTAPAVTAVSGRGVGLDAVLTRLRALRATIDVTSEAGTGTRFILTLPLTLTTIRVLLVTAGGQSFALDVDTVTRLLLVDPAELRSVAGRDVLMLDGATIPIIPLTGLLGLTPVRQGGERHRLPVLVLGMADEQAAIVVDELSSEQEIMVRSLGPRLGRVRYITGSTILQSGRIALILDARALIGGVLGATAEQRFAVAPAGGAAITRKRLLLAEDSLTTRTLMRNILEDAGYAVTVVADGAQAWERLQETGADLVVSDIDMPNMGGFELTAVIRGSERFRNLPVVLITARESEADKERGMTVGADAYLVKSVFDQANLLETITQFL